ncbi:MAG: hypothetical protein NDJ90_01435 [Oligoflexia bacterium]|nr:hypothetical protein [Oligoflexia bacterium]
MLVAAAALLLPYAALTEPGLKAGALTRSFYVDGSDRQVNRGTSFRSEGELDENGNPVVRVGEARVSVSRDQLTVGSKSVLLEPAGGTGEQQECDQNIDYSDLTAPESTARSLPTAPDKVVPGGKGLPSAAREATLIASEAEGLEWPARGREAQREIQEAAFQDYRVLGDSYAQLPAGALGERFERAVQTLSEHFETLSAATAGLEPADRTRFRNTVLNARDKASWAAQTLAREAALPNGGLTPFDPLLKSPDPLARGPGLAEVFGGPMGRRRVAGPDGLADRYVLYAGLPETEREKALARLRLVQLPELTLRSGGKRTLPLLHNGDLRAPGKPLECSQLVSSLLSVDARKTGITSLDLMAIWRYRKRGVLPDPPKFEPARREQLRKAADAFNAIDVYAGEKLAAGDLLVYRQGWDPLGYVYMVTSYNPKLMKAGVLDASQGSKEVRERVFPLTADPPEASQRFVRPGLHVLRLKPVSNQGCVYSDATPPAAGVKGVER